MLPRCSQVGHLGRQVGQLRPILAATWRPGSLKWGSWGPTWRQLGTFWASRGRPKSAKIETKAAGHHPSSQGGPQELPDPPPDLDFSSFRCIFKSFFERFLSDSCTDSASFFKNFGNILKGSSGTFFSKVPKEGGAGVRPQGVFDMIIIYDDHTC